MSRGGIQLLKSLTLQPEARLHQPVQLPPHKAIDGDHGGGHRYCRCYQQIKVSAVHRLPDGRAESNCGNRLSSEMEILGHNTRIPCSPRSCDQPGDEVRENARQYESLPTAPCLDSKNVRCLLQVSGDCYGSRDYIE